MIAVSESETSHRHCPSIIESVAQKGSPRLSASAGVDLKWQTLLSSGCYNLHCSSRRAPCSPFLRGYHFSCSLRHVRSLHSNALRSIGKQYHYLDHMLLPHLVEQESMVGSVFSQRDGTA